MYMSKDEIYRRYKASGADDKAIKIVAELNGCKPAEMRKVIEEIKEEKRQRGTDNRVVTEAKVIKPIERHPITGDIGSIVKVESSSKNEHSSSRTKWTDDIKDKIRQGIIDGLSFDEIADKYNIDKSGSGGRQVYFKIKKELKEQGIELKSIKRGKKVSSYKPVTKIPEPVKVVNQEKDSVSDKVVEDKKVETAEKSNVSNTSRDVNKEVEGTKVEFSSELVVSELEISSALSIAYATRNNLEKIKSKHNKRLSELQAQVAQETLSIQGIDIELKQNDSLIKVLEKVKEGVKKNG